MTVPRRIRRRTFLLGAAGLGASLAWFGPTPFRGASLSPSERLASLLQHVDGALGVGREYLRQVPAEASPKVLTARVAERLPGGLATIEATPDGHLRELLLSAAEEDFRDLRTTQVHGWVLARTEARLCALAALGVDQAPAQTRR
jgi:hypothetical protein